MTKPKKKTSTNSRSGTSEEIKDNSQLEDKAAVPKSSSHKKIQDGKLDSEQSKSQISGKVTREGYAHAGSGRLQDKKLSPQSTLKKTTLDASKKIDGDHRKLGGKLSQRSPNKGSQKDSFEKSAQNKLEATDKKWSSVQSPEQSTPSVTRREKKPWPVSKRMSGSQEKRREKDRGSRFSGSEGSSNRALEKTADRKTKDSQERSSRSFEDSTKGGRKRNETARVTSRNFRSEENDQRFLNKKDINRSEPSRRGSDLASRSEKRSEFKDRSAGKRQDVTRKDSDRVNSVKRRSSDSRESLPKGRHGDKQSPLRTRRTPSAIKTEHRSLGVKPSARSKSWLNGEDAEQTIFREPSVSQQPGIRIQKWLSQQGVASRREAEEWIDQGLVYVNGKLVTEQGLRIDPLNDQVRVTGKHIHTTPPPRVYWLLHKPDMVLTSRPDGTGRASIYELESTRDLQFLVSPVGRLDYRTEGLLLLSNDGELVHRLCHPQYKVPRMYNVLTDGRLSPEEERALRRGITLEDGPTGRSEILFAHGVNLGKSRGYWYFVTVFEGRNRLVRRMFEHFGLKVVRLVRYGFGDLRLPDDLPPGEYRQLTPTEIKYLKDTVGLSGEET